MARSRYHAFGKKRLAGYSALCALTVSLLCAVCGCSGRSSGGDKSPIASVAGTSKEPEYLVKAVRHRPFGVAIHNGIMYMITAPASGNGDLSKISPDGTVQDFARLEGDFSGNYLTDKSFISSGIDFDGKGNVYITLGDRLIKILPDGTVTTIADGFLRCFDVKIDRKGNMYVADDKADIIYMFTPSMQKSVLYKGEVAGDFILTSLAFDTKQEYLYAREGRRVLKFKINKNGPLKKPIRPKCVVDNVDMFSICLDKDNTIYACTSYSLIRLDGKKKATTIMGSLRDPDGLCFGRPAFDPDSIYVATAYGIAKVRLR